MAATEKSPLAESSPVIQDAEAASGIAIDWEQFMGVKLFAWVGGFALFLGIAFFVKYSIDNNLISPSTRVAIGFLTGVGAIIGGLWLKPRGYRVTVETLCAAGVAVLYADIFASRSFYGLVSAEAAFGLMVLVTAVSFLLSVRLESRYVALLGLIGGFLTPPLLSENIRAGIVQLDLVRDGLVAYCVIRGTKPVD